MTTNEIIKLTKRLMTIPSTADNPAALKEAVDVLAGIVEAQPDVTLERFERNGKPSFLAYRGPKRPKKFDILLNTHVDVVPAKPEQFKPVEKNGKLYGRGALDMKGTAAVLTDVFCEMINKVPYTLALQIVSDEEIGGHDGVKLQIEKGVRADFVVIGEYANEYNTIYNAARGLCWADIAFRGKTAHGGHLWHGQNAIVQAGNFAGALLKRYPTPDKETWTTTASIANLSTPNNTYNKVPDEAVLKVDFRFTQEDPVFQSEETLRAFIASIDPDAELLNLATFEPAIKVEELNPYVQGLSKALQGATKKKPRFGKRPAGSDGRHYAPKGSDVIEFGLYGHAPHSDQECVELSSFAEYREIMLGFLHKPVPAKLAGEKPEEVPLHEALLRKLVSMQSISKDPASSYSALSFIEKFLTERGMHVTRFERNKYRSVIATTKPGNKPKVLLDAHIDVVPAPEEMFNLKLEDGTFRGRGVMDMKHAIAGYLTLVDALKDELDAYDFGIMITSDEEIGSNEGVRPLVNEEGYRPKVVVVPDGGNNWDLETFSKGVYWIQLDAAGKRAHASRPWEGDSAIRRLLKAISEIEQLVPANPEPTDTLLSVGTIQGGTTANQIPAEASAMLDIRTGSVEDHERLAQQITNICKQHNVTANVLVSDPPTVSNPEHPLIKPMVEIVEQVTGAKHGTTYDFAVTDGRLFSQVGIPTVVINPECGGIHTDDEWLSRDSFAQFCEVIKQYVRRVAVRKQPERSKTNERRQEVATLLKRLNRENKTIYVWCANYGFGLSKEHFMHQIRGGSPEGTTRVYLGCTNQEAPKKDMFMSLPYSLYFAGKCDVTGGEGHGFIHPEPSLAAHTIAHAYLITLDQFEEIAAQQNDRSIAQPLPLREAIQNGHASIGDGSGHYDELVFCGTKDDIPIFAVTATKPELPYTPPSKIYTKLLCKGLSEDADIDQKTAIDYILSAPGITGHYKKQEIAGFFKEAQNP